MKLDIPVPRISNVDTYEKDLPPNYALPKSYVRYCRPSVEEIQNRVDYNLDLEDETWLKNHPRFGTKLKNGVELTSKGDFTENDEHNDNIALKHNGSDTFPNLVASKFKERDGIKLYAVQDEDCPFAESSIPTLSLPMFQQMLDLLEKATEFETIITLSQAERLILGKIPSLLQIFKTSGTSGPTINCDKKRKKNSNTTVRVVINDVYNYWIQKRSKLKKPLMRKYWPTTATNDTNPHLVFRPREKEKYRLRKKRVNDYDAYKKMRQLRNDFAQVRLLLDLIYKREELSRTMLDMQCDWFDQRIYDMVDTSGLSRESDIISHDDIDRVLDIPKHFDTSNLDRGKKRKRKKINNNGKSQSISPVPTPEIKASESKVEQPSIDNKTAQPQKVVADQDHPPLFLHPLETRESYVSSWNHAVPFVSSYVDSHPTPTFRFRHRPRIGRGGRVIIDRLPRPGNPNIPSINVFMSGDDNRLRASKKIQSKLLNLLPEPLDHEKLKHRMEQIAADALSDDETNRSVNVTAASDSATQDENDGEEILVKTSEWMETDEQLWGEELCPIIGEV